MTRDEIIQMAQEAVKKHGHEIKYTDENVELLGSFAELVAARERETCAQLAEEPYEFTSNEANKIATIIRARSEK